MTKAGGKQGIVVVERAIGEWMGGRAREREEERPAIYVRTNQESDERYSREQVSG